MLSVFVGILTPPPPPGAFLLRWAKEKNGTLDPSTFNKKEERFNFYTNDDAKNYYKQYVATIVTAFK